MVPDAGYGPLSGNPRAVFGAPLAAVIPENHRDESC
jgi:hypothetical protein